MNDHEIDRMMLRAEPDSALAGMLHQAGQELLEEILSKNALSATDSEATEIPVGKVLPLRRRRGPARWLIGVAAAVAVALAVGLPMALFGPGDDSVIPSSEQPAIQTMNPYLLLGGSDRADWPMTELQEVRGLGSEVFTRSAKTHLTVIWDRKENQDEVYAIRMEDSEHSRIELLGVEADLFDKGSGWLEVLLETQDGKSLWIRGKGMDSPQQFQALVQNLTPVSEDDWLAGLPEDFVTPDESAEVGRQILDSVPVPDGQIDTRTFAIDQAQDYPSFAAEVVRPVVCTWFYRYIDAFEADDQARMTEIADVLVGSRDWAVMQKVAETQGWPQQAWEYADQAEKGQQVYKVSSELCQ